MCSRLDVFVKTSVSIFQKVKRLVNANVKCSATTIHSGANGSVERAVVQLTLQSFLVHKFNEVLQSKPGVNWFQSVCVCAWRLDFASSPVLISDALKLKPKSWLHGSVHGPLFFSLNGKTSVESKYF